MARTRGPNKHKMSRRGELFRILNRRQPLTLAEMAGTIGISAQHVRNIIAPLVRDQVVVFEEVSKDALFLAPIKVGRRPRLYVLRRDLPDLDIRC